MHEITQEIEIEKQERNKRYNKLCDNLMNNIVKPYNERLEQERIKCL